MTSYQTWRLLIAVRSGRLSTSRFSTWRIGDKICTAVLRRKRNSSSTGGGKRMSAATDYAEKRTPSAKGDAISPRANNAHVFTVRTCRRSCFTIVHGRVTYSGRALLAVPYARTAAEYVSGVHEPFKKKKKHRQRTYTNVTRTFYKYRGRSRK